MLLEAVYRKNENGGKAARSTNTYIIGVDMPRHVAVGNQLTIDIATDFTIPPTVVDVDYADHVPLQERTGSRNRYSIFTQPSMKGHLLKILKGTVANIFMQEHFHHRTIKR